MDEIAICVWNMMSVLSKCPSALVRVPSVALEMELTESAQGCVVMPSYFRTTQRAFGTAEYQDGTSGAPPWTKQCLNMRKQQFSVSVS